MSYSDPMSERSGLISNGMTPRSTRTTPNSNGTPRSVVETMRKEFVEEWCKLYGLDGEMYEYLDSHGYKTGDDLLTLYVPDINKFNMDVTRKCLLRGAILQYRQFRDNADRDLSRRGVVIINKSNKKKDYKSMWKHQANKVSTMDSVVMSMLKPEERDRIRELRRRLHTKRSTGSNGVSLYERILQQRGFRHGPTGSVSDGTESLSSQDSGSYKSLSSDHGLPPVETPELSRLGTRSPDSIHSDVFHTANSTPVKQIKEHVTTEEVSQAAGTTDEGPIPEQEEKQPDKPKKKKAKKKGSKKKKAKPEPEPDPLKQEGEVRKSKWKDAKERISAIQAQEQMPEVELQNKLEEMLNNLDRLSKEPLGTPRDEPVLSPEESALQTELALKKLEDELFSEEELAMLEKAKQNGNGDSAHRIDELEEEIKNVMQM